VGVNPRKFTLLLSGTLFLAFAAVSQNTPDILPGTILPVELESSLSTKIDPGSELAARVMQDVPLPNLRWMKAGAKVIGRVIAANRPHDGIRGSITFRFDQLLTGKTTIPITTDLRAIAGFMEVEEARVPLTGPDRGTPQGAWTTQQIGGDVVYREGGKVREGRLTVGKPVFGGVLARPLANAPCRGEAYENDRMQAFWVFSASACGTYGLAGVSIVHAGRDDPVGEITLAAKRGNLNVHSGDGMLLRVVSTGQAREQRSK